MKTRIVDTRCDKCLTEPSTKPACDRMVQTAISSAEALSEPIEPAIGGRMASAVERPARDRTTATIHARRRSTDQHCDKRLRCGDNKDRGGQGSEGHGSAVHVHVLSGGGHHAARRQQGDSARRSLACLLANGCAAARNRLALQLQSEKGAVGGCCWRRCALVNAGCFICRCC